MNNPGDEESEAQEETLKKIDKTTEREADLDIIDTVVFLEHRMWHRYRYGTKMQYSQKGRGSSPSLIHN